MSFDVILLSCDSNGRQRSDSLVQDFMTAVLKKNILFDFTHMGSTAMEWHYTVSVSNVAGMALYRFCQ